MSLPILPTTVIGSYAYPSWMLTALEAVEAGKYGPTDERELYDDACLVAIRDQESAGVDVITDGEMRRWYFVQNFYRRMQGLEERPRLRKVGLYGYDSVPRYWPVERVTVPTGLGIVDEFKWTRTHTNRALKATCPGPITLTMHIQLKDKSLYADRMELAHDFAGVVNDELKALVAAGADFIQIDEPSFAIIPGQLDDYVALFNRATEGVKAKLAFHVCFGNLGSRPRGQRRYGWMFPAILDAKCDQLVFEFANREMCELELCRDIAEAGKEVGVGLIDVKSFWVEPPDEVAQRIRETLEFVPADQLSINPDCGFFQLPRWLAFQKLQTMVAGTKVVRQELGA